MIPIIQAKLEYLSEIYQMIQLLARLEGIEDKIKLTEHQLGQLLFCDNPTHFVGMALKNARLVGLVMFNFTHHNICYNVRPGIHIEQLYVSADFRRQKIGKSLLKFVAEQAKAHDCSRIEWWASHKNFEAHNFYKNIGAINLSDWTIFKCEKIAFETLLREIT